MVGRPTLQAFSKDLAVLALLWSFLASLFLRLNPAMSHVLFEVDRVFFVKFLDESIYIGLYFDVVLDEVSLAR
jgi:hypothetical protein